MRELDLFFGDSGYGNYLKQRGTVKFHAFLFLYTVIIMDEIKLWEWCKTHGDYAGYLMRYPNGQYASDARMLMNKASSPSTGLNHQNSTQLNGSDEFDDFLKCETISDYSKYIIKYPRGALTPLASQLIQELGSQKPSTQHLKYDSSSMFEEKDFKACKTISDYEKFLDRHPCSKYEAQAREKVKKLKADQEAWLKKRKDEDEYLACKTIEDYTKYIETHDGTFKIQAENHIGALKNEPWQLVMLFVCNILAIATIIICLSLNHVKVLGMILLGLGLVELISHFVIPFAKRSITNGDNYLQLSGYLSIIGSLIFLLI